MNRHRHLTLFVVGAVAVVTTAYGQTVPRPGAGAPAPRVTWPQAPGPIPKPTPLPGQSQSGTEYTEKFTKIVEVRRNSAFELVNSWGNVVITGGGGEHVRIDATKRTRHTDEATARAALQEMTIQMTERPGQLDVRTSAPGRQHGGWPNAAVDFVITLPVSTSVRVTTLVGDVRVSNVSGELRATGVNVTAASVGRLRSIRAISNVVVTDAAGDDIAVNTIGGGITLRHVRAQGLELQSVSGNVQLVDTSAARTQIQLVSGNIDFAGALTREARYEMQSHSGNITLTVAGNTGFDVDAATFRGELRSDYGLSVSGGEVRQRGPRAMRGSVGDHRGMLTLRSFNGTISILKRK